MVVRYVRCLIFELFLMVNELHRVIVGWTFICPLLSTFPASHLSLIPVFRSSFDVEQVHFFSHPYNKSRWLCLLSIP